MEELTSATWWEEKQQDIKNIRQNIELVFMKSCSFACVDNGRLDYKFMLQHIQELADNEKQLEEAAKLLSVDIPTIRQALTEILDQYITR